MPRCEDSSPPQKGPWSWLQVVWKDSCFEIDWTKSGSQFRYQAEARFLEVRMNSILYIEVKLSEFCSESMDQRARLLVMRTELALHIKATHIDSLSVHRIRRHVFASYGRASLCVRVRGKWGSTLQQTVIELCLRHADGKILYKKAKSSKFWSTAIGSTLRFRACGRTWLSTIQQINSFLLCG